MPSTLLETFVDRSTIRRSDSGVVTVLSADKQKSGHLYRRWTNTPNYRAVKASSQRLPDNEFTVQKGLAGGGYAVFRDSQLGHTYVYSNGNWSFPTGLDQGIGGAKTAEAALKLLEAAKGQQWNVPVFIAEGRKTAAMVYGRALHLVNMMVALRKGNFGHFVTLFHPSATPPSKRAIGRYQKHYGKDPAAAAANAWLEMRYGWLPFMADVRSAVNTLMDVVDAPKNRIGSVRCYKKWISTTKSNDIYYSQPPFFRQWCTTTTDMLMSAKHKWLFRPNAVDLPARFGLVNPLEVIWELVPFSFVADWFLPIGDYLKSLDAGWRFNHHGGTTGQLKTWTSRTEPSTTTGGWSLVAGGASRTQGTAVFRQPITSVPHPGLALLSFEAKLGSTRAISAIALLKQTSSRFVR